MSDSHVVDPQEPMRPAQPAEEFIRTVGRGFIPGIKSIEWAVALATEVGFPSFSSQIRGFFRSLFSPRQNLHAH